MRLISLLTTLLLCLISTVSIAAVDIKPGEYVVFYHHDVLGSPVAATNEQGQVIWYEHNEAYGRSRGRIYQSGSPYGDDALEEANARQGYTGHTKDNSAGLMYMKARYYDERIGRFLSNDPVGFSTGSPMMFNRYAYANNYPYKYTDPDGEFAQYVGAAVAVAGGALTLYEAYGAYQSGDSSAVVESLVTGAAATAAGAKIASSLAKALAKLRSNTGINASEVADAVGDVPKGGFDSTGRVITKNGEAVTIRGKQVSPRAIEQAVKRGVPPKEIMKALDQGVPQAKQSLGEATVVRKGPKATVTTKENDTIITTIIGKQRPQF